MNQKLQKWLSILLVTVMLLTCAPLAGFVGLPMNGIDFALPAFAEEVPTSGTWGDNLTWNLDTDGVLTISGSGEMEVVPLFGDGKPGWLSLTESVRSIVIEDGITNIQAVAFIGCTAVTQVTVCADVAEIGMFAFANCTALERVSFEGESQLKTVYDGAFSQCSSLTDINFPAGVTYFGASVLEGTAYYADEANWIDGTLYCGSVLMGVKPEIAGTFTVRDGTTMIVAGAFSDCTSLTGVTIPDSITSIGASTFSGCTALTSVTIPDSVTSIGARAFRGCSALNTIAFPDSVTDIGNYAFENCTALTLVTIPDSVTSIGACAFYGCSALNTIAFPDSVTSVGADALEGTAYYNDAANWTDGVLYCGSSLLAVNSDFTGEINIREGTRTIAYEAFYYCYALNEIAIPDSVVSIGSQAFYCCCYLTNITFGEGSQLTVIGSSAFYNCQVLESIALPDTVTEIGSGAFEYCSALADINIPANLTQLPTNVLRGTVLTSVTIPASVTGISTNAFSGCRTLESIHVEEGNTVYSSADGVLYDKQQTTLCLYPVAKKDTSFTVPDTVTTVFTFAFDNSYVENLTVPASVTQLNENTFYCTSLTSITVDADNENYATRDGVLYNKDKTALLLYPQGKDAASYEIADTVRVIAVGAFKNNDYLTVVTIPASVTEIAEDAFFDCDNLQVVSFAQDSVLTSIGEDAFYSCEQLWALAVPASVTSIGNWAFGSTNLNPVILARECEIGSSIMTSYKTIYGYAGSDAQAYVESNSQGYPSYSFVAWPGEGDIPFDAVAFGTCSDNLTWVLHNDGALSINGTGALNIGEYDVPSWYSLRSRIRSLVIGEGVTALNGHAFMGCTNLTDVTLSSTVTSIDVTAFCDCKSLMRFTVDENNASYTAYDGVLYSKDMSKLVCHPQGKKDNSFVFLPTVTTIGENAFYGCAVRTTTVKQTVQGYGTFYMYYLNVPYTVTSVGANAFDSIVTPGGNNYFYYIEFYNPNCEIYDSASTIKSSQYLAIGGYEDSTAQTYATKYNRTFASLGAMPEDHTPAAQLKENEVAATCETEGSYDLVVYCADEGCNKELHRATVKVKALGHVFGDYVQTVAPDCENPGKKVASCKRDGCDATDEKEIPALGHSFTNYEPSAADPGKEIAFCDNGCGATDERKVAVHEHAAYSSAKENEVAATCEENGSYDLITYCVCGEEISRETVTESALGHSFTKYEQTVAPDCENEGKEVAVCDNGCKTENERAVAALGHSPLDAVRENIVGADCVTAGSYDLVVYCDVCGAELERTAVTGEALGHTPLNAVKENEVAATCEEDGSYDLVVYCDVCGVELSRETVTVNALGHSFTKYEQTVAPDCENAGLEIAYCDHGCQATDEREVAALGHTPREAVKENIVGADCVTAGSYDLVVYCDVCGAELERTPVTGEALGHTPLEAVKENEVAADCEKDGSYDLVVYCDVCGVELSRETVTVDALGHSFTKYEQTVAPDCENAGLEIAYCDHGCQATDEREVAALGHTPREAVKENEVAADCEKDGSYDLVVYCDVCGVELSRETVTVDALGHSFTKYEQTVAPDCENAGLEIAYCDHGCQTTDEREVPALGHTPLEAVKENEVAADCEKDGSYDLVVYCDVCGVELSRETVTVDALGHSFTKYEQTVAPDCENAGLEIAYCDHGCQATDEREVAALGHSFTKYEEVLAPDCENSGLEKAVCDRGCGAENEQSVPALGHSFTNYVSNNDATCEEDGTKTALCDRGCGKRKTVTDKGSKLPHIDEDGDEVCDVCGNSVYISVEECECTCHRTDVFNRFVYKIIQFIRRMFGINSSCDCGTVHTEGLTPFWKLFDILAEKVDE